VGDVKVEFGKERRRVPNPKGEAKRSLGSEAKRSERLGDRLCFPKLPLQREGQSPSPTPFQEGAVRDPEMGKDSRGESRIKKRGGAVGERFAQKKKAGAAELPEKPGALFFPRLVLWAVKPGVPPKC